jgi:hypothetical protein
MKRRLFNILAAAMLLLMGFFFAILLLPRAWIAAEVLFCGTLAVAIKGINDRRVLGWEQALLIAVGMLAVLLAFLSWGA